MPTFLSSVQMAIILSVSLTRQEATVKKYIRTYISADWKCFQLFDYDFHNSWDLPSLIAVGPSANNATTARVMATSGILFMLTSMARRRFFFDGSRGGPVTVTLVSVHVTFAPILSRTSANLTSPCIEESI